MFQSLFNAFRSAAMGETQRRLNVLGAKLDQRQGLLNQAISTREQRRIAARINKRRRKALSLEDRHALDDLAAEAAGSGLRTTASSKAALQTQAASRRAQATAERTSVLDEALAQRLARDRLARDGKF